MIRLQNCRTEWHKITSLAVVLVIAAAKSVYALSFSDNTPIIEARLGQGEAVQGSIELVSQQDSPIKIKAYLEDWRYLPSGDGNKNFAPPETLPRSCAGWISFYPQEFELPANGRITVDYTIRIPQDSSLDGGYYAVLLFEASLGEGDASAGEGATAVVKFSARVGSLFLVEINGTARREARLTIDSVSPPKNASSTMTISSNFANQGNVLLKCDGFFHVIGGQNIVVARGELPKLYVWPGDEVPVNAEWVGRVPEGEYVLVLTYSCGEELVVVEETSINVP